MMLFFIRADNECGGENLDLLVRARHKEEAIGMWRDYYELDTKEEPKWVGVVPDQPVVGPIPWEEIKPIESVPQLQHRANTKPDPG
jgi:hypothetical protein